MTQRNPYPYKSVMRRSATIAGLALLLIAGAGSAAEENTVLPAPQCLTRDGQPLPAGKDPFPGTALVGAERPVKISGPEPRWPRRAKGCSGPPRVWVQAVISTTGEVCAASLLKPLPASCEPFGESAVAAVRKWKFRPVLREGAPVAILYYVGIGFGSDVPSP